MAKVKANKRGLSEKPLYAFNPLPPITDRELMDKIGLEEVPAADKLQSFAMNWRYSAGLEREKVRLAPGEKALLRESEAREWLRDFRDQGGVLIELDASPAAIRKASLDGINRAVRFYRERGKVRILNYRKIHGLSKDEVEERTFDLWPYHLNEAKADFLTEYAASIKPKRGPGRPRKTETEEAHA